MKWIISMALVAICTHLGAQFQLESINLGETTSSISAVGIGQFAAQANFGARLHINNFACNAPGGAFNGLLFRTDGDQSVENRWQFFTGTSESGQTERFRIRVDPNGFDTYLTRTQTGSEAEIQLLTAQIQLRARGKRLGDFCEFAGALADEVTIGDGSDVNFTSLSSTDRRLFFHGLDGFLGLGSGFSEAGLNPNYNFQIHDGLEGAAVYQQFTNANSGSTASDGLRLGLNPTTSYELRAFDPGIWLDLAQNNAIRLRIRSLDTYSGLNNVSYLNVSRIMVPLRNQDANVEPMSMMQLGTNADGALERTWMNVGTTYGANADAMYVGWMERANSNGGILQSDAVIAWGCQRGASNNSPNSDNFRIVFLAPNTDTNADNAGSEQGKEVLRIEPFDGNVGIGNFSISGNNPPGDDEYIGAQLDIDGDLRIRELEEDQSLTRVLVADPLDLNRVHWRSVASIAAQTCEWNEVTNGTSDDLVMGYAGACNEGNVGIGTDQPDARLEVHANYSGQPIVANAQYIEVLGSTGVTNGLYVSLGTGVLPATESCAIRGESQGSYDKNYGGYFEAISTINSFNSHGCTGIAVTPDGSNAEHIGVNGIAKEGVFNFGVSGLAGGSNGTSRNFGVIGQAVTENQNNSPVARLYGVYGVARVNSGNCGYNAVGVYGAIQNFASGCNPTEQRYAGYFSGNVEVAGQLTVFGMPVLTSDQSLKTDIQPLESVLQKVMLLNPTTYSWDTEAHADLNLSNEQATGFIAQEVLEVFPEIVSEVQTLPQFDEENNEMISEAQTYLGLKYDEFIPILTKAIQEQQVMIETQQSQINALTDLVNSCCSADAVDTRSGSYDDDIRIVKPEAQNRLDQNAPNPFTDHTTLRFSLAKDAQAKVCIYNSNGQLIDCLIDGNTSAGEHSLIWNTSELAPGIYFYSLEVDGFEQVRRAVKL